MIEEEDPNGERSSKVQQRYWKGVGMLQGAIWRRKEEGCCSTEVGQVLH
jgi:hypothetical protein